jgi:hypothetical protein
MTPSRTAIALGLALAAACSNNSSPHGTLTDAKPQLDAAHGSGAPPADAGPQTIQVVSQASTPTYVAYRAGDGAWKTPALESDGYTYDVIATDDYVFVAAAISTDGSISIAEVAAMAADGMQYFYCYSDDDLGGGGQAVAVTGTMKQPGMVQMLEAATGSAANWTFSIAEPPSFTTDLFAVDSTSMMVMRDVAIGSGATQSVGTIDLSSSGTALVSSPITIANLDGGDTVSTTSYLSTANYTQLALTGTSATAITIPPATLVATSDFQTFEVDTHNATSARREQLYTTVPTAFTLLADLTGITFSTTTATWSSPLSTSMSDFFVDIEGTSQTAPTYDVNITAMPDWLTATHATSLAIDESAPGWQPTWSFWTTKPYQPGFGAELYNGDTSYASVETLGASASPAIRTNHLRRRAVAIHRNRH